MNPISSNKASFKEEVIKELNQYLPSEYWKEGSGLIVLFIFNILSLLDVHTFIAWRGFSHYALGDAQIYEG